MKRARFKRARAALLCAALTWCGNAPALSPMAFESEEEQALKMYVAPDGTYRVEVPSTWRLRWTAATPGGVPAELRLIAASEFWPHDTLISVTHYAGAHRTPERYLRELIQPRFGGRADAPGTPTPIMVAGRSATVLEVATQRYPALGMTGDPVPALIRTVVVPDAVGFFVLRYDVPQQLVAKYQAHFALALDSFAPSHRDAPAAGASLASAIPAAEYAVYEAFFRSPAPRLPDGPQFFDDVPRARTLLSETLTLGKHAAQPDWPASDLRGVDPDLAADYRAKNTTQWLFTDLIDVPDMRVISRSELNAKLAAAGVRGLGVPRVPSIDFPGSFVALSRVAFNRAGDTALFKAAQTNPGTTHFSYLVLMRKQAGGWVFADVAGQEFMIR